MDEPPVEDAPKPEKPERSLLGPLASCLALALLLGALAGGGALLLREGQAPPVLTQEGEALSLSWGGASLPVLLGPGCEAPGLTQGELPTLSWQSQGQLLEAPLAAREDQLYFGPFQVTLAEAEGKSLILMPSGRCRLVDSKSKILLKVERWEGSQDGLCVVWVYSHPDWILVPEVHFDDGTGLLPGQDPALGSSSGGSWSFMESELAENWTRELLYSAKTDSAIYVLNRDGKVKKVPLQRAMKAEWSLGDPAPDAGGH